jgi:hypothetical protein
MYLYGEGWRTLRRDKSGGVDVCTLQNERSDEKPQSVPGK